jgi:hypothetical protein
MLFQKTRWVELEETPNFCSSHSNFEQHSVESYYI